MKKILLFVLLVLSLTPLFSQQKKINLVWETSKTFATDTYAVTIPVFSPSENFSFDIDNGIQYINQWKIDNRVDEQSVKLTNVNYQAVSKADLKNLNLKTIPKSLKYQLKNSKGRNTNYAVFSISPIIKDGNNYKKITGFTINYTNSNTAFRANNTQTITNSALGNGDWYKFVVLQSGIHRISKTFLSDMGINVDLLDPRNIKVFGNGGRMMPYDNSANFPLDPQENAIKIIGEEDGVFNDTDFILFYAEGPSADVEVPYINTNLNPYSDSTVYYINISGGQGKRVQDYIEPVATSNITFNTFQEYQFHEVDETNIVFVGRRWFGEKFGVENSRSFDFVFPNLVNTEPVNLKIVTASNATSSSSFAVNVNNTVVGDITLSESNPENGIYATEGTYQNNININADEINVVLDYDNLGNPSASAYLDYIGIEATRDLTFAGQQFDFFNKAALTLNGVGTYTVSNTSQVQEIWDVTDLYSATSILNETAESTISFNAQLFGLKKYVIVSNLNYYEPIVVPNGRIFNQNIKGSVFLNNEGNFEDVDYLMLTTSSHLQQAERLAQINRDENNLKVKVITLQSIYNEFSSGNPDISGIRNFVKYVYDNASTPENRVKYLCLFGDASFDYKERIAPNTYNFPVWNAYSSFNLTNSFISDDFFAYVDEDEGNLDLFNNSNKLDIAVGRIVADSPQRAKDVVDKVEVYYSKEALGSWRNNFIVISDDVDEPWEATLQITTDEIGDEVPQFKPFINVTKIHTDSFQQEASAGGDRYPEVNDAINNAIENGALIVNYFGHGGEDGLAFERIFQKPDAEGVNNVCRLNLFITVTCEFTRFDNPLRLTAGELTYWNKGAGAISLISTTRQIFVTVGRDFNNVLKDYLFSFSTLDDFADNEFPTIAEALMLAKNDPTFSNPQKNLVFYVGDPALTLAFPQPNIRLTKINDVSITQDTDVLQALSYAKLEGEVTDVDGNVLTNYNGVLTTTIYDKEIERQTLANDNTIGSGQLIVLDYKALGSIVFRGQASITNGKFDFDFVVPKDIGIPVGDAKVSFYATRENSLEDKAGASIGVLKIGGINPNAAEDNIGPKIQLFMNDEAFASGGITNESPTLIVKFEDENGINTASGIGHDIVALIDGDEVNPFVLNDYYLTEIDDFTKGGLSFPFRDLSPGLHTLSLKAWDVYNNSSIAEIQFMVFNENESLVINNVLNYPNPFVTYTEFWFSHNSSDFLDVTVQIFTISGKLVKTLNGHTTGIGGKSSASTSRDIVWDGRDDFGDRIGKGTYVYKLKVHSPSTNKTVEKIEKLVIL